ncbi:APC family permease [Actinoplanes sp. LDG1-06]|uniref:APC family permease n=1 Tax=Paractinoplanes ovalisporus TaxID=2810368 RepID=A0ABS2AU92_9ACTN|nr:APC family permease [Actinoplanes ovalisporus]MBM2623432.1 APC family permease [Actinoplanes ovalisporus]
MFTAAVVASSPQTVLVGGIPTTYQRTGVAGVPLSFVLVMMVVGLLVVACVAVGGHVRHGAPFYAQLAHGLSPLAGLVAAGVAFVGYNALQISLYPLLGVTVVGLTGVGTWWSWALVAWLLVLLLGRYPGAVGAKVLGVLLALELAVIVLFILAGFTHPAAGGVSTAVFGPSQLLVAGAAASVIVFAVAAFAGLESVLAYAEEATSYRAVAWAAGAAVVVCGLLYTLASWAYGVWLGLDNLSSAAGKDGSQPLVLLGSVFGVGVIDLATALLVTSVLAAMGSFHATVARYVFALSREQVLPASWGSRSRGAKGGAPVGGSWAQAITAAVVLVGFLLAGADPMAVVFPWLSTIGAFCILLLLTAANWSAFQFFDRGLGRAESVWVRRVFPFAGGILGVLAVVFMASSLGALLGTRPGSGRPWLVAAPIVVAVLAAWAFGSWLRQARPEIYAGVGRGVPDPATVLDDDLEDIEV